MTVFKFQYLSFLFLIHLALAVFVNLAAQEAGQFFERIMRNDIEGVKELIASGADINQQNKMYGHTPLIVACNYNFVDLAKLLISEGADVNITGKDGSSALIAAASNSEELVEILISIGADIKAKMKDGTGVFTQCVNGILMGEVTLQLAEFLVSKGADVNEAATTGPAAGYTPLMIASRNNKLDLVNFLIKNGANVNAKSKDGSTALYLAVKKGHQEIIKVLKSHGAK